MQDSLSKLASFARQVEPTLETRSYYELLNVTNSATLAQIRAAYYQLAAQLHPDRYLGMSDREAKEMLERIYARITEGYRVLTDIKKRQAYDQALTMGSRRLVTKTRENKGPQRLEDSLKNPEAKKFFQLGMNEMNNKNWKGAIINFNMARAYEPSSPLIQEKLATAKARQTGAAVTDPAPK